jgi:lauroyl/myristoyl acyltransferase
VNGAAIDQQTAHLPSSAPSSLYRSHFWRLGLGMVRVLPRGACVGLARVLVRVYWNLARKRREVVIQNLEPALPDRAAAEARAKALFQQFAVKLVDLWRYEAGLPVNDLFGESKGWEHLVAARERNKGVLLLTPHLGDWEFGGPWLARQGVSLQVITLAEPGNDFTKLRQASRARWNIETIVIRDDPFAFVEVIRRLESGATVALLIDRPPSPTATTVELFGRPFNASIAASELARASGCALVPVYIVRSSRAYCAHVLPELNYDRLALRDREARRELTQRMMTLFEPAIRQHLDQWYHFVPIWPSNR